jgi:dTDP-4-amino-4,6-dideoxygalactose transaminase
MPLINQPIYRRILGDIEDQYPVTKWLNASGFYIGCHQYLTDEEMDYMAETVLAFFGKT